jgi:predicted amidohydrolase
LSYRFGMRNRTVTAAIVQAEVASDLESGLALTRDKAIEAAASGAELIVFPETWIPGYPAWLDVCRDTALWDHAPVKAVFGRIAENSVAIPSPAFDQLCAAAREASATLVVGLSERVDRGAGRGTL